MLNRAAFKIFGEVQGVGFRPFIYRLATDLNLKGRVKNSPWGVWVEVHGQNENLNNFVSGLKNCPGRISNIEKTQASGQEYESFLIVQSQELGEKTMSFPKDYATCSHCLKELNDPSDRRYQYPFINCTLCGPRYSIIEKLPYDRKYTSMQNFQQCEQCLEEYENPNNRRYHAQANACQKCGPRLSFTCNQGVPLSGDPIGLCIEKLKQGKIIAIKGIGGFHLFADAKNSKTLAKLRKRKKRPHKPFALMAPSLEAIQKLTELSAIEKDVLTSKEAPIILLRKKEDLAQEVAFDLSHYGVMLPYTPLHHLLMQSYGDWLVATSGNISGEAICIDNEEALQNLKDIANYFCFHDRNITQIIEDSVIRIVADRILYIRKARGYAPSLIDCHVPQALALGGELKNTLAYTMDQKVEVSPFIGDLLHLKNFHHYKNTLNNIDTFRKLQKSPRVTDMHPEYQTTKLLNSQGISAKKVQHHLAHIASVMAEWCLEVPVLGVSFDGTGFGMDGKIWGGEWIEVNNKKAKRIATLRNLELPLSSLKSPWITAASLVEQVDPICAKELATNYISEQDWSNLKRSRTKFETSSMGRLFDAIAYLAGFRGEISYEGQAAIWLENQIKDQGDTYYPAVITNAEIDWRPMIKVMIQEGVCARAFHQWIIDCILEVAKQSAKKVIVLSGGCFQNAWLLENAIKQLKRHKYDVYWAKDLPPNDGGLSLGQLYAQDWQWEDY
ncbi:carbamoyltransferase HypF [Halobacteriovorax sp. GFR7]|uniref:carbamoyltransferase HypF n=1 Tax=unclassified Halobacteriovorax TaxID=2639665 RepID=UPI003D98CC72